MPSTRRARPDEPAGYQIECLLEAAGDAVLRLSVTGTILYASKRTVGLLNQQLALEGRSLTALVVSEDRELVLQAIERAVESGVPNKTRLRIATSGQPLWFELQFALYAGGDSEREVLVVGRDISAQQATEERLRHMATHDALTGLPNRSLLSDRIRMAVAHGRRVGRGFAVLALDLDGFKKVNDALGHPTGDALL
ncbi:MAG TPA: GGDEF domain-containing protein, partial [Noviherbaspirillum sp.]